MPADSLTGFFFLFIAAACGWAVARFFARQPKVQQAAVNPEYFKGLNYLLDDKPDQAIEVFLSMMAVDNETVETHFALGSLFRRRGEVDRAIRIHQNLIARPNLGREHRDQALFALAEDYLRAGLLDRAENLFEKLADQSSRRGHALRKLTSIFEQQGDWNQAIAARRKLNADVQSERILAHYYCELADAALAAGDSNGAKQQLKKAQSSGPWLARSAMLRARIALDAGDRKIAQRLYRKVIESDARFLTEIWPAMRAAFAGSNDEKPFADFLSSVAKKNPDALPQLAYAAIVHDDTRQPTVTAGLEKFLQINATLREALLAMQVIDGDALTETQLERIADGLRALLRNRAAYFCQHCGYASEQLYWQCPGCKSWDTVRPNTQIPVDRLALAAGK
ncbi:MAG: lipopolysaccharide assembly protein LapB [Gammaproteobacteria bacterium]